MLAAKGVGQDEVVLQHDRKVSAHVAVCSGPSTMSIDGSEGKDRPRQPSTTSILAFCTCVAVLHGVRDALPLPHRAYPLPCSAHPSSSQFGSYRFWCIFPWVVSGFLILVANFFTLLYALRYFAFSDPLMFAWLETVGISLALGFGVFDVIVIIVRNNLNCTKVILQTRKYQVLRAEPNWPSPPVATTTSLSRRFDVESNRRIGPGDRPLDATLFAVWQVIEKFVVGPIVAVLKIWQKVVLDFCCGC